ncbi:hypothetical protein PTKIN_Ptkin02bG0255300 [Pterospermum kingtungense]
MHDAGYLSLRVFLFRVWLWKSTHEEEDRRKAQQSENGVTIQSRYIKRQSRFGYRRRLRNRVRDFIATWQTCMAPLLPSWDDANMFLTLLLLLFVPMASQYAIGVDGDVRKEDDAARTVESTFKRFGRLDILVNAAAGNFLVPAEDLSPNGFRTVIDIDSVGTFRMCHEALKYLKKGGPGKEPSRTAAIDDTAGVIKLAPEEILNKIKEKPLYTFGEKWDIAMAALYLASGAGKFVNGTIMVVDGGQWLSQPRLVSRDAVKQLSRREENKSSRISPAGLPKSKL